MNITASTAIPILARYGLVMPPLTICTYLSRRQRQLCWRVLAAHEGDCLAVHDGRQRFKEMR